VSFKNHNKNLVYLVCLVASQIDSSNLSQISKLENSQIVKQDICPNRSTLNQNLKTISIIARFLLVFFIF